MTTYHNAQITFSNIHVLKGDWCFANCCTFLNDHEINCNGVLRLKSSNSCLVIQFSLESNWYASANSNYSSRNQFGHCSATFSFSRWSMSTVVFCQIVTKWCCSGAELSILGNIIIVLEPILPHDFQCTCSKVGILYNSLPTIENNGRKNATQSSVALYQTVDKSKIKKKTNF